MRELYHTGDVDLAAIVTVFFWLKKLREVKDEKLKLLGKACYDDDGCRRRKE